VTDLSRWLIVGARWLVRLTMVPVVARRHRPTDALAWLALIFALPWLGPALYFLFGEVGLRRSVRRHARVRAEIEADERVEEQESWAFAVEDELSEDEDVVEMVRLVDGLGGGVNGLPILSGNRVDLLVDTDDGLDALVAAIDEARLDVHLLFFIFAPDAAGERVAEALLAAARRGVSCRVLADDYGSGRQPERSFFDELAPRLAAGGVEVETMLPIRLLRRPFARGDIRNHRKIAVIDGRLAFTGSLNIHDADFDLPAGSTWRQLTLRIEGPAVHQLQVVFVEDWYFTTGELLERDRHFPAAERCGDVCVQTVPGGPTYESDFMEHLVIAALNGADRRAIVATPYFVPTEATMIALRLAALRGAQVQLVVPRRSDQRLADLAGRSFFPELLRSGIEIHLHDHGMLHAKALSVDDRFALVGSANFDRRSFRVNYEVNLVLYGRDVARRVRECQEGYLADAEPIDPEAWERRPRHLHLLEQTTKLMSPLL